MGNKVQFGLSNVHVAFLNEGTGVYEAPVAIPGSVKLSLAPEGDESEFYADNIAYFTAASNQGYKGDLEMALVPDAVLADMLGWEVDSKGALVEIADGSQMPFALLFEIEGDANARRCALYKCTASRPNDEHGTKGKSVEPNTQTLPLTVVPTDIDGKLVVKSAIERSVSNATVYDGWYTAVTEPTFPAA